MSEPQYYILEGVRRSVAAREHGLPLMAATLKILGQPDRIVYVPLDQLHSPKTSIVADQRCRRLLRLLSTPTGRTAIMKNGRILIEPLGALGQTRSLPLAHVVLVR